MKINWFSPLPPAATDIAHYTARTLPALTQHAEVTLWTEQQSWDKSLQKWARVETFRGTENIDWTRLNRADISFYHIGNNPLFHGGIWRVSQRNPGVVVLHDMRLHHFFDGLYREQARDRDGYLAIMERYYGPAANADAIRCYDTNASNINEMAECYPLTRLAVENALGVLVHTHAAFHELQTTARQPVVYAPLPFAAPPLPDDMGRAAAPPYRLIVFGYLGRNRRLGEILQALAGLPEKDAFRLDIYGSVTDQPALEQQIINLGLSQHVTIYGFVAEQELDAALSQAHLALNLRYPTMGEASGSQLRIWAHALPSLVTRTGWYATLDETTAAFVRPDHEIADIQKQLRTFLTDPPRFAALGTNGRKVLEAAHAPENYAESLRQCAETAQAWRGKTWAYQMAERVAGVSAPWQTPQRAGLAGHRVIREISLLAGWQQPTDPAVATDDTISSDTLRGKPALTWRAWLQGKLDEWLLGASPVT